MDDTYELRMEISRDFIKRFERYRMGIGIRQQEMQAEVSRQQAEQLMKKVHGAIARLKTGSFKNNLIKEAREWFYKPRFDEWIDENHRMMGLNDAVLEIVGNKAVIRDGKPEDYISKSCGISWPHGMTKNHPQVRKLKKWFRQTFTDKDLRRYFWKSCAYILLGGNVEKLFFIWTGEGDNSKSMIVKLFEATFGVYCIKFPTSLLTGKRTQSSAPMPELAQAKSARQAFLQEPESEESIKAGLVKELTGGDTFFARSLFSNGAKIKPSFCVCLMTNKIPPIPNSGRAIRNRLRIIPFMSTWVDDAPQNEEEQFAQRKFKKDPLFEEAISKMAPAFLFMLTRYFTKYMTEKLAVPKIVDDVTNSFWMENDVYQNFLSECVVPALKPDGTADTNAKITYTEFI